VWGFTGYDLYVVVKIVQWWSAMSLYGTFLCSKDLQWHCFGDVAKIDQAVQLRRQSHGRNRKAMPRSLRTVR
jgi:hypothetical protein